MKELVSILLVGIGGFGNNYVRELVNYQGEQKFKIVGAVDPRPENCPHLFRLQEMKVPIYDSMEAFYEGSSADLAIISTPIQFHRPQTCYALSQGSHVLCEKPISATIQDVYQMIEARDKAGKFLAIGYQWSYSDTIQDLKKDILSGMFGKPKRLKTILLWPRNEKYYSKGWIGKKKDQNGEWVLDSVINNAGSHYLHNMFFVLGNTMESCARPKKVTAELYHATNIENFDTGIVRVITEEDIEMLYYATHATKERIGPRFVYEYENAEIVMEESDEDGKGFIRAKFHDGRVKEYGNPYDNRMRKLWASIDAVKGKTEIACSAEAALSQTLCINAIQESMPYITKFPDNLIKVDEKLCDNIPGIYVEGLNDVMKACYNSWKLPSESGISWAKQGKEIDLTGYAYYKGE